MAYPGVTFRPFGPEDMEFLFQVYASTRMDEMAIVPWDDNQKADFLNMQFNAQHTYYQEHYKGAAFDLILLDGEPIGRLYLTQWEDEMRVIDIAILPEYRNRGIGRAIYDDIMAEAKAAGKTVSIHVEQNNPARRLYDRLGFRPEGDESGIYVLMVWHPDTSPWTFSLARFKRSKTAPSRMVIACINASPK